MELKLGKNEVTIKWSYWPWIAVALVFVAMTTIVAPGRGAPWNQDEAYFLQIAWNAAHGFGLDYLLPQAPHYFVHALLMKLGVREILHFRYFNHAIVLLSSSVFFLGMDNRRFQSPLAAFAICASLFVSLYAIQGANSLALAFFLLGGGCYFFATDGSGNRKNILLMLCGILFAFAGFMHAAVAIAMLVLVSITLVIDRSVRYTPLVPSFLLVLFVLWGIYIHSIGMENLLVPPAGHNASAAYLFYRIRLILRFYQEAALAYGFVLLVVLWFGGSKFSMAQSILSIVVTLFYGATLITYVTGVEQPQAVSGIHAISFLTAEGQWVMRLPGAAFFLMCFAAFRWLGEGCSSSFSHHRSMQPGATVKGYSPQNLKFAVAILGILLLQSSTAVGSETDIIQGMVFFAGPAIGVTVLLWDFLERKGNPAAVSYPKLNIVWLGIMGALAVTYAVKINTNLLSSMIIYAVPAAGLLSILGRYAEGRIQKHSLVLPLIFASWMGIVALFAFTYNHSVNQPILSRDRVELQISPLRGIRVQPRYADSVTQLLQKYQQYNCAALPLVTLEHISLVYYILEHSTPGSFGLVAPSYYFPADRLQKILDLQNGWCVLDVPNATNDIQGRPALRAWIAEHSDRMDQIPSPSADIGDIRLYVRNKRDVRQ